MEPAFCLELPKEALGARRIARGRGSTGLPRWDGVFKPGKLVGFSVGNRKGSRKSHPTFGAQFPCLESDDLSLGASESVY